MNATQPRYATVYDIPERPRLPVPQVQVLRYEEIPTTEISDTDEEHCLTGYGEISVSECYDVLDAGEDEHEHRVPRLRHAHPYSRRQSQTTRMDSDLFEPEYFRHLIKSTSEDPQSTSNIDFHTFFENLRNAPQIRRQRTLLLRNSPASEAIDARPRSN